jgi:hypothetical protein
MIVRFRPTAHALVVMLVLTACGGGGSRDSRVGAAEPTTSSDSTASPAVTPVEESIGDATEAVAVVRAYYRAIDERRYRDAYRLWGSEGAASGKSMEQFEAGFSNTVAAELEVGAPGPIEGAAGSRYVEVPVMIRARLRDGTRQEFSGTYTLRRSVVDGATAEQRAWRMYSAKVRPVK